MMGTENKGNVKKFISKNIGPDATLLVDGAKAYEINSSDIEIKAQVTLGNKEILSQLHPWMHRFVSNAKAWIL